MKISMLFFACMAFLDSTSATRPVSEENQDVHPNDRDHLIRLLNPDRHNRVQLPGPLDPYQKSIAFVRVPGGRILTGSLGFNPPPRNVPRDVFYTRLESGRHMVAGLRTIRDKPNPEVRKYECFIAIRKEFNLASILEIARPDQVRENHNVFIEIREPNYIILTGLLLPVGNRIPAWVDDLIQPINQESSQPNRGESSHTQ